MPGRGNWREHSGESLERLRSNTAAGRCKKRMDRLSIAVQGGKRQVQLQAELQRNIYCSLGRWSKVADTWLIHRSSEEEEEQT